MSAAAKWPGNAVPLGGTVYIFPRMSFGDMEELGIVEMIEAGGMETLSPRAQVALVIDMAHRSLRRNAPEITRSEVAGLLDQDSSALVFDAIMNRTGFSAVVGDGEGNVAGVDPGVGQSSTPT